MDRQTERRRNMDRQTDGEKDGYADSYIPPTKNFVCWRYNEWKSHHACI